MKGKQVYCVLIGKKRKNKFLKEKAGPEEGLRGKCNLTRGKEARELSKCDATIALKKKKTSLFWQKKNLFLTFPKHSMQLC